MSRGQYVPDIGDIAHIASGKLAQSVRDGETVWHAAGKDFRGNHCDQTVLLRLPYWMDESLRAAAADLGLSPQEALRYLLASMVGAPKPGWSDRKFSRYRGIS